MDASLKTFILACYDERIALCQMPEGMREALKTTNRVPVFLKNLHAKVEALPPHLQRKEVIRDAVYSLTDWFIEAFKKHADERQMSEVAKQAMKLNEERKQILKNAVDTGIITDEVCDAIEEGIKETGN